MSDGDAAPEERLARLKGFCECFGRPPASPRLALRALERAYQEMTRCGYSMKRTGLADFLTECREPDRLAEAYIRAEREGLFQSQEVRNRTINRYGGLMLLADHLRQRWGTLHATACWGFLCDAERGVPFGEVRARLEEHDPGYQGWKPGTAQQGNGIGWLVGRVEQAAHERAQAKVFWKTRRNGEFEP